jgi:predicted transcriptional regulator
MNSPTSPDNRREQAITLRRAGKSRREIKEILGITSNETLGKLLAGEPAPGWTRRPNAKDDLHAKARRLREQGFDYNRIAAELGVSKSSVSLWVRDLPRPERLSYEECRKRAAEGVRRYWEAERAVREGEREATRVAAAAEIGALTQRELLIAGSIAYWCEGAKSKPHRRCEKVEFINSDPRVILFFLHFLDAVGIERSRVRYRIYIHENADSAAAGRFWLEVTGAKPTQFQRPTLKRHNPKTVRKNVGDGYHGCLTIRVYQSADLYRRIEGWARAALNGTGDDLA